MRRSLPVPSCGGWWCSAAPHGKGRKGKREKTSGEEGLQRDKVRIKRWVVWQGKRVAQRRRFKVGRNHLDETKRFPIFCCNRLRVLLRPAKLFATSIH